MVQNLKRYKKNKLSLMCECNILRIYDGYATI